MFYLNSLLLCIKYKGNCYFLKGNKTHTQIRGTFKKLPKKINELRASHPDGFHAWLFKKKEIK